MLKTRFSLFFKEAIYLIWSRIRVSISMYFYNRQIRFGTGYIVAVAPSITRIAGIENKSNRNQRECETIIQTLTRSIAIK